jgi:gluconate 5-dehydrogenase
MTGLFDLTNTVAIVTGAGQGNGLAIAQGLVGAGANVIGVDIRFAEINRVITQINGDVTSQKTIEDVRQTLASAVFDHLVLVNNAGVTFPQEGPYPLDRWNQTLEVNLTAPFLWIEGLRDTFCVKASGSIINITSLGAERAFPNNPAYIASKGGLKMLSKYYAKALGPHGVRVNNIGPGYMVTEMTLKSFENGKTRRARENHTFLGRWGQSSDLVGTCIYLSSPASSYVTGQDIYVDGGWTANGLVNHD